MVSTVEGSRLVSSGYLSDLLQEVESHAHHAVSKINPDELLQRPPDRVADELFEQHRIQHPCLVREGMTAPAVEETRVDVRYDFNRPFLDQSRPCYVPGARIRLRVPFRGPDMFRFRATRFSLAPPHGLIKNSTLIVGRSVPSDVLSRKRESVIAELRRDMDDIEESLGWVVTDLNRWEPDFRATIEAAIQRRRDDILAMRKTEFMLGVPIERDGVIAETYAVPALTRRSLPRPVPRRKPQTFHPRAQHHGGSIREHCDGYRWSVGDV